MHERPAGYNYIKWWLSLAAIIIIIIDCFIFKKSKEYSKNVFLSRFRIFVVVSFIRWNVLNETNKLPGVFIIFFVPSPNMQRKERSLKRKEKEFGNKESPVEAADDARKIERNPMGRSKYCGRRWNETNTLVRWRLNLWPRIWPAFQWTHFADYKCSSSPSSSSSAV